MYKKFFSLLMFVGVTAAQAAYVGDCDEENFGIYALVAGSEKTFYEGKVATYQLSRGEPASSTAGIAINLPIVGTEGEPSYVDCKVVAGLGSVDWSAKRSSYDEQKGLLLKVPATEYNPTTSKFDPVILNIRINLEAGSVSLE